MAEDSTLSMHYKASGASLRRQKDLVKKKEGEGDVHPLPSVCRLKVRPKVCISSGQRAEGRKQTGAGSWGWDPRCFLRGGCNMPFAAAA